MALLSLLFDRPKNVKINSPDEKGEERELLLLDMTRNISHQSTAEPTENPVEDGIVMTDHVDVNPDVLSFEGIMSDAPITLTAAVLGNVAGAVPAIGGFAGTVAGALFTGAVATLGGLLLNTTGNRVQEANDAMLDIQKKAIPVTIITGLKTYKNMILQTYNPTENAENGGALVFQATFKEIRAVTSVQIPLPASSLDSSIASSAASKLSLGKVVANGSTRGASFLSRGLGIGG